MLVRYMKMLENTEAPRIFHIWSLAATVAAMLGRRCYLPWGDGELSANIFVILAGSSGLKKSSSIGFAEKFIPHNSTVRTAPTDTGFQRQGLLKAMLTKAEREMMELREGKRDAKNSAKAEKISTLKVMTDESYFLDMGENADLSLLEPPSSTSTPDDHCLFVVAEELVSLIGHNNMEMIGFLSKMYDGNKYDYSTSTKTMILNKPLLSLLAGTNPLSLASSVPIASINQGFMPRTIFVHADEKYKEVPILEPFNQTLQNDIHVHMEEIAKLQGTFKLSPAAMATYKELYTFKPSIGDIRFASYIERRTQHLLKLSMAIAAMDLSMTIENNHVEFAHEMLWLAERNMHHALGFYDGSTLSKVKQDLLEWLRGANEGISFAECLQFAGALIRESEFSAVIQQLTTAGDINQYSVDGNVFLEYRKKALASNKANAKAQLINKVITELTVSTTTEESEQE